MRQTRKDVLDALLCEYQACHLDRDHYDGTRWIIGSIFTVTSFTLFGISLLDYAVRNPVFVILAASLSLALWFVFLLYDQNVQPLVEGSLDRALAIETELQGWGLPMYLHSRMSQRNGRQIGVGWIIACLTSLVVFTWAVRLAWALSQH